MILKNKKQKKATPALALAFGKKVCPKSKRSQEEMIGFALIIVLVAVILLIFLGFSLRSPQNETIESYEVESFIQAFLQYTTDCKDNLEFLSIKKLIFACSDRETCLDRRDTCEVLDSTLKGILEESWKVGENLPYKGYTLQSHWEVNSY